MSRTCSYRGRPKFWEDALSDVLVATLQCPTCGKAAELCEDTNASSRQFAMPSKSNAPLDELNREGNRIQELIERINEVPDASSREILRNASGHSCDFTGGLARVLELSNRQARGQESP